MERIRVGMIGTGGIAHWHGRQLKELPEVEIAAIADTSAQSRQSFAEAFGLGGVPAYDDYLEMLANTPLDAVVICSPHTLHFKQATDVLNQGLHVLIEKPMTCSSEEALALIETARAAGKVMQVSYQRHFQPEFLYIKDAIARGEIGKLTSVSATLCQEWLQGTVGSWRQNPALSGGGFLMDSGSHIIDAVLWTTGLTPAEVKTVLHQHGSPVEIDTFTSIRFEEGAVGSLNLMGYAPGWYETYLFNGEEGSIVYEHGRGITIRRLRQEPVVPTLPPQTTNQDKSFIDAVLGRREVAVSGEFAYRVVKFSEMVYQAAGYSPLG